MGRSIYIDCYQAWGRIAVVIKDTYGAPAAIVTRVDDNFWCAADIAALDEIGHA